MKPPRRIFYPFKFLGLEVPLPAVAIYVIGAAVTIGVCSYIYQKVYDDPERALLTQKEINSRLAFEVEEYGLHMMEEPAKHELLQDNDGQLSLRIYTDHCVLIQRKSARGMRTKLIPDLTRDVKAQNQIVKPTPTLPGSAVLFAEEQYSPCARGCLNPHPGQFRWWYGAQRGEWVEVWRQWPEGCEHVQMFSPRAGIWDSNPDGTPRVRWTCCIH